MLTAVRRKLRIIMQRMLVLAVLIGIGVASYSYVDLEFCFSLTSRNTLKNMCKRYEKKEYSGSLCEELCSNKDSFRNFKCPEVDIKTTAFTTEKNGDVYAIKHAKNIADDLTWSDSSNELVYPRIEDFHHIVKMHIILSYNVTLDDNMIRALVNQEIDNNSPEQMLSFWRLYRDNNYMMGKLFDEEFVFPTILGSCGPFYATEHLNILQTDQSIMQYISNDWQKRLKLSIKIMEYIFHLDEIRPEPLKMCKMKINLFGLTTDKRIKYQNAEYAQVESQVDRRLSNGARCQTDEECNWHACMGKCDPERFICNGIQQNNNMQIFCEHLLKGSGLFPGLLASSSIPRSLSILLKSCINPSILGSSVTTIDRPYAVSTELALRFYNELKRFQRSFESGVRPLLDEEKY